MNAMLIVCAILVVLTWASAKFSFISVLCLVSTVLFCGRKIGYFCKLSTVCLLEGLGIFLTVVIWHAFGGIDWKRLLVIVVCRLIFLGICYYDSTQIVYEKVERRKDSE